jgi:hypothetical protein
MDANFGLVRKKSAGRDVAASTGDSAYFLKDDVVKAFTDGYEDSTKKE